MKKITLIALLGCFGLLKAQINYETSYNNVGRTFSTVKLHQSGYKYLRVDIANLNIELYNINHSLFKSINIPSAPAGNKNVYFVSENLFDLDNQIEYVLTTYSSTPGPGIPNTISRVYLFKENGTQLMFRDSASISDGNSSIFNNISGVYFDGVNTKMRLQVGITNYNSSKTEIYSLPGSIPCAECSSTGTVSGIAAPGNPGGNTPLFYPNPVSDQLKLKYELPRDYKNAEIKIYDLQGKLIETMKVTDSFEFIYLPSDYSNGLYLYELKVDGKTIKTEKVILNK